MWDVTVGKTIVIVVLSGGGRSNIKRSLSSVQAHRVFCVSCVFSHLVCSRIVLVFTPPSFLHLLLSTYPVIFNVPISEYQYK